MAKVVKYILTSTIIFVILIVIGIIYSIKNTAQSEEHPLFPEGVMNYQNVPIYCGSGPTVFAYASSIFKQKSIAWSETFAWVSFWYSPELKNGSMFLTVKATGETCLMGYGMDWIFDTELLLDIVNEQINKTDNK